jgi:hypothetical protein
VFLFLAIKNCRRIGIAWSQEIVFPLLSALPKNEILFRLAFVASANTKL